MADVWSHAFDEEEQAAERQFASQNDATAFLIDAGPAMLKPHTVATEEEEDAVFGNALSFLGLAIRLVEQLMRSKIISSENDTMSVTFYGTRETGSTDDSAGFANVYTLQRGCPAAEKASAELKADEKAMDVPSAARIGQLTHLPPRFEACIGTAEACDRESALMHGIWTCGELVEKAFAKGKRGGGARRIIIITNDASPLKPGSDGLSVLERARLCKQTQTLVQVIPLVDGLGAKDSFWSQLHNDPDAPPLGAPAASVASLREDVRRKVHKKRRLCALELLIAPGGPSTRLEPAAAALAAGPSGAAAAAAGDADAACVRIACGLFSLVAPAQKGAVVKVDRSDFSAVKSRAVLTDPVTAQPLAPEQLAKSLDYPPASGAAAGAAHKLVVPSATAAALRRTGCAPGLRVLGFMPSAAVTRLAAMRAPYFAYPDEGARTGSTTAFTALLRAMLRADVAALAVLVRAPGAAPRLAALLPQAEERDSDGGCSQRTPPGLHVMLLPYAEDARAGVPAAVLPPRRAAGGDDGDDGAAASDAEAAEAAACTARAAADVVRVLRLQDFRCHDFCNPALQRHYAYLEALALAEEFRLQKDEREEDPTLPAPLPDRAAAAAAAFAAEIERVMPHPDDGAGAAAPAASRKRAKAEAGTEEAAEAEAKRRAGADSVAALLAAGPEQLKRATVAELKAYLAAVGLKQTGVKAELLERVLQHASA